MPDNSNIDLDTLESRLQTAEADEGLMRQYVEATSQLDAERGKKFLVQLLKTPSAALACFGLAMQAKRRRDQTMLQIWAIEAIQRDPQHRLGLSLFDEKNAASLLMRQSQSMLLLRHWICFKK